MHENDTTSSVVTNDAGTLEAQLREGLARLRRPTRELLSSLKDATPEVRGLALVTSPFAVRAELLIHGLATDESGAGRDRCALTPLGLAALEFSRPLSPDSRRELAAEADRALADAPAASVGEDPRVVRATPRSVEHDSS